MLISPLLDTTCNGAKGFRTIGEVQEFSGSRHIGRDGDVCLLCFGNLKESLRQRIGVLAGSCSISQLRLGRHRGRWKGMCGV
jgi:hypothetical protein